MSWQQINRNERSAKNDCEEREHLTELYNRREGKENTHFLTHKASDTQTVFASWRRIWPSHKLFAIWIQLHYNEWGKILWIAWDQIVQNKCENRSCWVEKLVSSGQKQIAEWRIDRGDTAKTTKSGEGPLTERRKLKQSRGRRGGGGKE